MNKNFIIAIVIIAVIVGAGIFECIWLQDQYYELIDQMDEIMLRTLNEEITQQEYLVFVENWKQTRENSELLLPHLDVYEMNLRIAEAYSCIINADYKQAYNQLSICKELAEYIPHLMKPIFRHIF